ncbi:hypothetical protein JNK13_10020 [bacterium]|nr:hypothetical protein [bacterium]
MGKLKKLPSPKIRKITGGKEPAKLVEEFLVSRGFNPEECLQQRSADAASWSVPIAPEEELEISIEGLGRTNETTIYMGINIMTIPTKNFHNALVAALTVADTLIGAKLSLVNYDLVLSITSYANDIGAHDLDYLFELISKQKTHIYDALIDEIK